MDQAISSSKKLVNEFSWSFSRHQTFTECEKRYWYTYYGSWEGWPLFKGDSRKELDSLAAYLYTMKQMQHFSMFIGSVVHKVIENALKKYSQEGNISLERILQEGKELMHQGIVESENELWRKSPKKRANIFEVYYAKRNKYFPLTEEKQKEGLQKITTCLENWFWSPIVQKLILSGRGFPLSVEHLDSFYLKEHYKVYVVIDLSFKWRMDSKHDILLLFDWKTGEETEKTIEQLYSYALYAHKVWNVPYDKMILTPFYLYKNTYDKIGHQQEKKIEIARLQEVENFMIESSKKMLEKTYQGLDISFIQQKVKEGFSPCAVHFSYAQTRSKCRTCPFKELCEGVNFEPQTTGELRKKVKTELKLL